MGPAPRLKPRRAKRPLPGGPLTSIEIHTEDGRALRAYVREPAGKCRGTVVLAHAMFARSTEFERPVGRGLAPFLAERGFRTVAFDFRGHGESGPGAASGGTWSYDDLVWRDLPCVVGCARARARTKREPVIVIGHSLGGHVAMASQGVGALGADGIVGIAANVWLPQCEPFFFRLKAKEMTMRMVSATCRVRGFFPARALRLGSDDESATYMRALARAVHEARWRSDDGAHDYERALAAIRIPVLALASANDPINCHPDSARALLALCGGPKEFRLITQGDGGAPAPGHMGLVTGAHSRGVWESIVRFLETVKRAG